MLLLLFIIIFFYFRCCASFRDHFSRLFGRGQNYFRKVFHIRCFQLCTVMFPHIIIVIISIVIISIVVIIVIIIMCDKLNTMG